MCFPPSALARDLASFSFLAHSVTWNVCISGACHSHCNESSMRRMWPVLSTAVLPACRTVVPST